MSGRARLDEWLGVALVLAIAIAFRVHVDNSGDSPWTFQRNDEVHYLALATDFLNGRFEVDYFINPTFYAYLVWAVASAFGLACVLAGRFESFAAFRLEATLDSWWLLVSARVIAIVSGVAAVALVYMIGRKLRGPRTGLIAALALAVDATHAERSIIGVNEAPMVALVLAFFLALLRHIEQPSFERHALAGALLGLACSTKYNAGVHVLTLAAGTWLAAFPGGGGAPLRSVLAPRHQVGFLAAPIAFLAGSPAILVNPAAFWRDFRTQSAYLEEGFVLREKTWEVNGWRAYVERFPGENVGLGFSVLCALGLVLAAWYAARRREHGAILLLVAVLPIFLFLGSGRLLLMRFLLPAIPFVLLAGAWVLDLAASTVFSPRGFARAWGGRTRSLVASVLVAVIALALLAPQARATWRTLWVQYGRDDRRAEAARMLRELVEPNVRALDIVYPPILRFFDDFTRVRPYRIRESDLESQPERARWQAFQSELVRSTELTAMVDRCADMQAFRSTLAAEGQRQLLFLTLVDRGLRADRDLDAAQVFEQRRQLWRRIRTHEPALDRCAYWEELLDYLVALEPVALRLTSDRQVFVSVLALPDERR